MASVAGCLLLGHQGAVGLSAGASSIGTFFEPDGMSRKKRLGRQIANIAKKKNSLAGMKSIVC